MTSHCLDVDVCITGYDVTTRNEYNLITIEEGEIWAGSWFSSSTNKELDYGLLSQLNPVSTRLSARKGR